MKNNRNITSSMTPPYITEATTYDNVGGANGNWAFKDYINAKKNNVNIIRTHLDTFTASKLIGLSNYAKTLLTDMRNISFNENDYYTEFKEKSIKLGHNNYPVVDDDNNCLGLIRITDIKNKRKLCFKKLSFLFLCL